MMPASRAPKAPPASAPHDHLQRFVLRPDDHLPEVDVEKLDNLLLRMLKELARRKRLSVVLWAKRCKRGVQTLRDILNTKTKQPPRTTLERMSNALNCRLFELERICVHLLLQQQEQDA